MVPAPRGVQGWGRSPLVPDPRLDKVTCAPSGTPCMFPTDAAGDRPGREHHHAAGKVHRGQGVPAEGGADEAGVPDPAPQCGAVQRHPTVQVSTGAWKGGVGVCLGSSEETECDKGTLLPSGHLVLQLSRALGRGLECWGASLQPPRHGEGWPSTLQPSQLPR